MVAGVAVEAVVHRRLSLRSAAAATQSEVRAVPRTAAAAVAVAAADFADGAPT